HTRTNCHPECCTDNGGCGSPRRGMNALPQKPFPKGLKHGMGQKRGCNAANACPERSPQYGAAQICYSAARQRGDAFGYIIRAVDIRNGNSNCEQEKARPIHRRLPLQLEPGPAVQPKQWLRVAILRLANSEKDSMSQMVFRPGASISNIWLK